jgi:hypothetical protein
MTTHRGVRSVGALLLVATTLCGCSSNVIAGEATAVDARPAPGGGVGTPTACAHVDAQLADIPSQNDAEPQLRVPQPAGWVRDDTLDSALIRYRMVNNALAANSFPANIVVALIHIKPIEPQGEFDKQEQSLRALPSTTNLVTSRGKQCGLPAATLTFNQPAVMPGGQLRQSKVRSMVVGTGGQEYLVTATVQSAAPDNLTYQQDAQLMLDGLQVSTPGL